MSVFDARFPSEMVRLVLLAFDEEQRRRMTDCPNLALHPPYCRIIERAFEKAVIAEAMLPAKPRTELKAVPKQKAVSS